MLKVRADNAVAKVCKEGSACVVDFLGSDSCSNIGNHSNGISNNGDDRWSGPTSPLVSSTSAAGVSVASSSGSKNDGNCRDRDSRSGSINNHEYKALHMLEGNDLDIADTQLVRIPLSIGFCAVCGEYLLFSNGFRCCVCPLRMHMRCSICCERCELGVCLLH